MIWKQMEFFFIHGEVKKTLNGGNVFNIVQNPVVSYEVKLWPYRTTNLLPDCALLGYDTPCSLVGG
jgi:hypothetical protein